MFVDFNDPQDLAVKCQALAQGPDERLLLCLGPQAVPLLEQIVDTLASAGIRFFGGIFPALLHDGRAGEGGAIVQALPLLAAPAVANIEGRDIQWTRPLPGLPATADNPTCFVLADFACVAVSYLLESLFNAHANEVNYLGAGAGTGTRVPSPVIFDNDGVFTGSALVAYVGGAGRVGLRHGWSRTAGPVVATRTSGNVIKELNWEPAISVYRSLVGDDIADSLRRKEDVPAAKRFPFGIAREDMEDVIRDPLLATADGELVVLSDVPEHSVMHILQADSESLIAAAHRLGADFSGITGPVRCLLFDCYSRAKLLGDDISSEIQQFAQGLRSVGVECDVEGVLALGEIASDGNRMPEFHNKTVAAGVFRA